MLSNNDKLEYIHCVFQEVLNGNIDKSMLETSLQFVEEIREESFSHVVE